MLKLLESIEEPHWRRRSFPVSVAGYVGWAAIAFDPLWRWVHGGIPTDGASIAGLVALCAVPILFALANPSFDGGPRPRLSYVCRLLEAPVALIACWGLKEPLLAALLVIASAQVAAAYTLWSTLLLFVPLNVALALIFLAEWDHFDVVVAMLGYGSFQAFTILMVNSAQRAQRGRDEVLRINAELLATRQLLLEGARDEERLRISRELHDLVGHKLTALKLQLRMRARLGAGEIDGEPAWEAPMRIADELLNDVRGVVSTLREGDGIDLHEALAALIPAVPLPKIELRLHPQALVPGLNQAHALLRCAQEGLTNALRHSGASRVVLQLDKLDDGVALQIQDDGQARTVPLYGHGLTGMRERLEELGGKLEITARIDHGLCVQAWLPHVAPVGSHA